MAQIKMQINLVKCNFTSVNSVVSKKVTTENTEKHICRSSLMQFHLGELCGFKKVTTKNTEKIIDKDRFLLIRLCPPWFQKE
jgi:hypothetical protein